nr:ABC transporter permease [candidate division Zixibacteria bacterium]
MRSILVMALTDLKILSRDKLAFFWVIGFPFLMAIFFGSIFSSAGSGVSQMKIAAVDQDRTEFSSHFIRKLMQSEACTVTEMPRDSAFDLVRQGKMSAYIVLRPGFTDHSFFGAGDSIYIELGIDPARRAEAGYLQGLLMQSLFLMYHDMLSDPKQMMSRISKGKSFFDTVSSMDSGNRKLWGNLMTSLSQFYGNIDTAEDIRLSPGTTGANSSSDMMMRIDRVSVTTDRHGPRSSFEVVFPSSVLWGVLACAATFATSVVRERERGTYLRLRLAPIGHWHILAGKGLACFLASSSVSIIILAVGHIVFGVRISSYPMLLLAVVSAALCFVGIMMFLSIIGRTEQSVSSAGWSIMLVMAMLGGGMLPLIFMPSWMQKISSISPIKWSILAIEGAVWRNFSFSEMMFPVGILLGIGIVTFLIGVKLFARFDN